MSRLSENLMAGEGREPTPSPPEFSPDHRRTLLRIAHESIISAFADRTLPTAPPFPCLLEPRGAFTTLYLRSKLRGCVGYAMPVVPLYLAVAETARAAAFDDSRFCPVTKQEAVELELSLSVLSRLITIRPEEVEVGRHGLVISFGSHRGLLLPQVPVECDWTAKPSSNKLAAKPACLLMPGKRGLPSKPSPPRSSAIAKPDPQ